MPRRSPPPPCKRSSVKIPLRATRRHQGGRPKHRTSPWSRKWVAFRTALRNSPVTPLLANTRESIYAAYMATWRDRVQRIGNLNYPSVVRQQRLIGSVVLEVVVGRSGNLLDIHIVKSSGRKTLDDTAIQLARLASPFAPLPAAIRRKTSALHITRTWRFTNNAELFGAPQIRIN